MEVTTKKAKAVHDEIKRFVDIFTLNRGAPPQSVRITKKQAEILKATDGECFFGRTVLKIQEH